MAKESGKRGFLDFFKVKDLDDEDEFDDDLFDEDEDEDEDDEVSRPSRGFRRNKTAPAASQPAPAKSSSYGSSSSYRSSSYSAGTSNYSSGASNYGATRPTSYGTQAASNKLVDFNAPRPKRAPSSSEVYVIRPTDLSDAQTIADFLNGGMTIVINMEGIELTLAQRIIDIVFGAVYSMGGSLNPISNNIFIAAPNNIEVTGDFRNEILSQTGGSPLLGR